MPSEIKVSQLLAVLTRQTVENKLAWEVRSPPRLLTVATNTVIPYYMECKFRGERIGLGLRRQKEYFSEEDEFIWAERTFVVIVDDEGRSSWEYQEPSSSLMNLFELAREKASRVEDIFSNLLEDDSQSIKKTST